MNNGHERVVAWQKAHQFVFELYKATTDFPKDEQYGITSQIRRAAVSIPANIAEGKARGTDKDYVRFLYIARGSCAEVEYLLLLSKDLGLLTDNQFGHLDSSVREVGRVLNGLIKSLS
jgi:four helix bundle protein